MNAPHMLRTTGLVVVAALWSVPAFAWSTRTCNGKVRGMTSAKTYRLNRCSISAGGTREGDVLHGMDEWNAIYGMYDRFNHTSGSTSCSITTGDGKWDFGYSSSIDGANGVTKIRMNGCTWSWSDGDYKEADILISSINSFDTGTTACDTESQTPRRGTILHEMGHALGMKHDSRFMSLMHSSSGAGNTHGKYCGAHTMAPHPDDVDFGLTYHGSGNASWEFGASGFRLSGGNRTLTMSSGTTYVCPGDSVSYTWSYGNRGTRSLTSSNRASTKILLSTNTTISSFDTSVHNWTVYTGRGGFSTLSSSFTVPSSLSWNTTYYIGVWIDDDGDFSETYENNNTTHLARRIRVRSASQCP